MRGDFVDTPEVSWRELYLQRADIFFEIAAALGAGDGDDVVTLREKPRQG